MAFYVYMLASRRNGTLYIGHTDSLARRTWAHQQRAGSRFAGRYGVTQLVWFEVHGSRDDAFRRERQLKKWRRAWKLELIERENPSWRHLGQERLD